jgi:hypothetical protein
MDQLQSFKRVANNTVVVHLVIIDIPDNLTVSNISMANGEVPTWNVEKATFLNTIFYFTNTHLQNDDAILLFHEDSSKLRTALKGFFKVYHFKMHKEWMGVNWLRMTRAKEGGKTVIY